MPAKPRSSHDDHAVSEVRDALASYWKDRPAAAVEVRRYSPSSIHVRVTDPEFRGSDRVEREERVWPLLETLPDEVFTQVTVLLLLTPDEVTTSYANAYYFESPSPAP